MKKVTTLFSAVVIALMGFMTLQAQEALIISEYIEGSSNNKAIELFNTTDAAVSLDDYQIAQSNNGGGWQYYHTFPTGAEIAAHGTWVMVTNQVDSALYDTTMADEVLSYPSLVHHNGNDARAIIHISGTDTTIIDVLGDPNSDADWDVAGVTGATGEHTLVRKASVTEGNTTPLGSFGTTAEDSEWIVYDQNNFYHLGTHAFGTYVPEVENGTIVNVNSDLLDTELGPTSGVDGWFFVQPEYADYEIVPDPDNNSNKLAKITVTDLASAPNAWAIQAMNSNNELLPNSTYLISARLKNESVSDDATADVNFVAGSNIGRNNYGLTINSGEWVEVAFDTLTTGADTLTGNIGFHFARDTQEDGDVFYIDYVRVVKLEEPTEPEPVTVNFTINTATIPDTVKENHFIQLRGAVNGAGGEYLGQMIDWNDASDLVAENVGGDYWELSFQMMPGDEIVYKVWSGFDETTGTENGDGGWEIINPNKDNRTFVAPASDTSAILYADSETAPFESVEDSVTMFFRVNVGAFVQDGSFDPTTDNVVMRGNPDVFGNPGDWSSAVIYLDQEDKGVETSDNLFYSGSVRVDQAAADTIGSVPYKFVLETAAGELWDNKPGNTDGNRFIDVPSADSTIHWVFFQEKAPTSAEIVTTDITFEVNVAILEVLGYFDSGVGDQVVVRGEPPLDWGTSDFNTASFDDQDIVWRLTNSFTKAVDSRFAYKYYIEYDESRTDATSENYIKAIDENVDFGYEEPVTTGGGDRFFTVESAATQETGVQYYNGVNIGGLIDPDNTTDGTVSVTFRIDMTDALDHEVPFRPDQDSLYFQFESKYTALTQGVRSGNGYFEDIVNNGSPEDLESLRFTPVDGETNIYELTLDLQLPTLNDFGYVVKYGQPFTEFESMVTNGSGFAAGRRYYQFIEPTSVSYQGSDPFLGELYVSQWPTTYTMPTVVWKAEDLPYDVQPDYADMATSVEEPVNSVNGFKLSQNYPNPFNPTTNITFDLAKSVDVNLTVYNLLGQKVKSLVSNKKMGSGTHTVAFDASSLASGVYFYRLEAGDFVANKRMTLIK